MNTSLSQPEISNKTALVSVNQVARPEPDDIKTDSADQQSTDSQSESSRDKIDVASPNSNEETSVTEGEHFSGAKRTTNNQKDLIKLCLQTCLKRREDVIYREDQNLEFKVKHRYKQNLLT